MRICRSGPKGSNRKCIERGEVKYRVTVPVIASGHQTFVGEAPNPEKARDLVESGAEDMVFESEDLYVDHFNVEEASVREAE